MNKTKEYTQEIEPLVNQIIEKCNDLKIPMFMTFALADNGKDTTYKNRMIDAPYLDVKLSKNNIVDHMNIVNGFTTIYPQQECLNEIEV